MDVLGITASGGLPVPWGDKRAHVAGQASTSIPPAARSRVEPAGAGEARCLGEMAGSATAAIDGGAPSRGGAIATVVSWATAWAVSASHADAGRVAGSIVGWVDDVGVSVPRDMLAGPGTGGFVVVVAGRASCGAGIGAGCALYPAADAMVRSAADDNATGRGVAVTGAAGTDASCSLWLDAAGDDDDTGCGVEVAGAADMSARCSLWLDTAGGDDTGRDVDVTGAADTDAG